MAAARLGDAQAHLYRRRLYSGARLRRIMHHDVLKSLMNTKTCAASHGVRVLVRELLRVGRCRRRGLGRQVGVLEGRAIGYGCSQTAGRAVGRKVGKLRKRRRSMVGFLVVSLQY